MNGSPVGKGLPEATPAIPGWPGRLGGQAEVCTFHCLQSNLLNPEPNHTRPGGSASPAGGHTRHTPHRCRGEIKENARAPSPPDGSLSSHSLALFTPACRRRSPPPPDWASPPSVPWAGLGDSLGSCPRTSGILLFLKLGPGSISAILSASPPASRLPTHSLGTALLQSPERERKTCPLPRGRGMAPRILKLLIDRRQPASWTQTERGEATCTLDQTQGHREQRREGSPPGTPAPPPCIKNSALTWAPVALHVFSHPPGSELSHQRPGLPPQG